MEDKNPDDICVVCGKKSNPINWCDEEPTGAWCDDHFPDTPCGKGGHDEGCQTRAFSQ
jgi:hypothetical protein